MFAAYSRSIGWFLFPLHIVSARLYSQNSEQSYQGNILLMDSWVEYPCLSHLIRTVLSAISIFSDSIAVVPVMTCRGGVDPICH